MPDNRHRPRETYTLDEIRAIKSGREDKKNAEKKRKTAARERDGVAISEPVLSPGNKMELWRSKLREKRQLTGEERDTPEPATPAPSHHVVDQANIDLATRLIDELEQAIVASPVSTSTAEDGTTLESVTLHLGSRPSRTAFAQSMSALTALIQRKNPDAPVINFGKQKDQWAAVRDEAGLWSSQGNETITLTSEDFAAAINKLRDFIGKKGNQAAVDCAFGARTGLIESVRTLAQAAQSASTLTV